jgi:thymidylate synthase ThyX
MNDRLAPYVTNLDRDVFALRNLPEEVVAVLFAYYSRSRDDLRTNLGRLLDDQELAMLDGTAPTPSLSTAREKARAFHERWVVGYGHASVAEHAVVHLAVERCSIVAAKALEEARLAAYTEKSTRYVRFDEGTLVTDLGLPAPLAVLYERTARALLADYVALIDRAEAALLARYPAPGDANPRAHSNALRAHACDLMRGLLPAGVPTNLGITLNARVLEHHIGSLLGSPLAEVRRIAAAMRDEASIMTPTLLKYTAPRPHRDGARTRVAAVRAPAAHAKVDAPASVTLVDHTPDALTTLATAIRCECLGEAWSDAHHAMRDEATARAVVAAYLAERGAHDAPLRALEYVTFRFEVRCDYGAWRDLQRHRLLSATTPLLGTHEGYWLSPELTELGLHGECAAAIEGVTAAHREIASSHPWEAQYVVPLARQVRYVVQGNLRELFHLIELRSARQGHESYRHIAQLMADGVLRVCPWLDGALRVDRNHYPWARH